MAVECHFHFLVMLYNPGHKQTYQSTMYATQSILINVYLCNKDPYQMTALISAWWEKQIIFISFSGLSALCDCSIMSIYVYSSKQNSFFIAQSVMKHLLERVLLLWILTAGPI